MQPSTYLEKVRKTSPLIHHITNYVTVNDCANVCLAVGGSPVMADAIDEAADMASISSALVLNIGTLNVTKVESMISAGTAAHKKGIPVILDPVGCGATPFRNAMAVEIMEHVPMTVIRGNSSEIFSLAGETVQTKGVDAGHVDQSESVPIAQKLAAAWQCVVVISGVTDIVTDGKRTCLVHNGCEAMSHITGTGCMASTVVGTFCGASPANPYEASAAAMMTMGLAGEQAWKRYGEEGLGHFHMGLIDALGQMTGDILDKGARYEER